MQIKQVVADAVASHDFLYGFASFNQDRLYARSKHWLYRVSSYDPWGDPNPLPRLLSGRPYPEPMAEEVFGWGYRCDEGSGFAEVGCYSGSRIAHIDDPTELARVQRLPKLGSRTHISTTTYVQDFDGQQYKLVYRAVHTLPDGTPNRYGNDVFAVDLEVRRCVTGGSRCQSVAVDRQVIQVFAVGYGIQNSQDLESLDCMAENGGTDQALLAQTQEELWQTLYELFDSLSPPGM
ncbi:MAG: hypothetical protein MPN21_18120 [Thermoanaerobaculia bacterium]|nr:hypothetical protein [Thermoanaerobaculia bacterium]